MTLSFFKGGPFFSPESHCVHFHFNRGMDAVADLPPRIVEEDPSEAEGRHRESWVVG